MSKMKIGDKIMFRPIRLFSAVCAVLFCGISAAAAPVPLPKLVKIVVPFSPGASNDVFGRALAEKLANKLGVNVIVENKPGAGGTIGALDVARSKRDGSTLLFSSTSFVTNAATNHKLPYDALKDFEPVAVVARGAMLLVVGKDTPYQNVSDFVSRVKQDKERINYGSAGIGSIGQMSSELLNVMAGSDMVHVPYKGITNATSDMIGGRLETMITTPASISGPLQSKEIRPLAVTSLESSRFYPDLPTIASVLPDYSVDVWWGMYAPAGTPKEIINAYNSAIREVSSGQAMRALFAREATEPTDMDVITATAYIRGELEKWQAVAKDRHIAIGN
jgi:tripartite-type tricarboxylate transporter receptor subunit TctC